MLPKYDETIEFLQVFRPNGPHLLTALPLNDTHDPKTRRFKDTKEVKAWCESLNQTHNLYYHAGMPKKGVSTRMNKSRVQELTHLFLDVDPVDGQDFQGERRRIWEMLKSSPPDGVPMSPGIIKDTGNGFQALWKLPKPLILTGPESIETAERYLRFLVKAYKGDSQATSVDQLLRLPGTLNIPNAAKLKKKRVVALSSWFNAHQDMASLESFGQDAPRAAVNNNVPDINVTGVVNTYTRDTLPDVISEEWKSIIDECEEAWGFRERAYPTRSEGVFAAVRYMLEKGIEDQVIYDILRSPELSISEHVNSYNDIHRYAKRQITEARKKSLVKKEFTCTKEVINKDKPTTPPKIIPSHLGNIRLAIRKMEYKCTYNEFEMLLLVNDEPFEEHITTNVRLKAEEIFKVTLPQRETTNIINAECRLNSYHPVREYLDSLPAWDKVPRLDTWLHTYAGCSNEGREGAFNRAISAIILIAAVRRIRQPGCKFDEILILEGPTQGRGKSELIELGLLPNRKWFSDSLSLDKSTKEFMELTSGHWIIEIGELGGLRKADIDKLKQMLSRRVDKARMAWGRSRTDKPRQFILFGTTNREEYLTDPTGNRRFWPARTSGNITANIPKLAKIRDQLWAETSFRESVLHESIRLDPGLYLLANEIQESRMVSNPIEEEVSQAIGMQEGWLLISTIMKHFDFPLTHNHGMRKIASALRHLDFSRKQRKIDGVKQNVWQKGKNPTDRITLKFDEAKMDHM